MAAAQALSVSEAELQRVKARGCAASVRDRNVMRLPNLKAIAYPVNTQAPVELSIEDKANDKLLGRSSLRADGFVPPFSNETSSMESHGVPGLDFAGSGDLLALNQNTFNNSKVLYKEIAANISGQSLEQFVEATPTQAQDPETPYGRAGIVPNNSIEQGKQLQQRLYGAAQPSFADQTKTALRGVCYDLLHLDEARRAHGNAWCTREGRGPYLLFVVVCLLLVLWLFSAALRSRRPVCAMPSYYWVR